MLEETHWDQFIALSYLIRWMLIFYGSDYNDYPKMLFPKTNKNRHKTHCNIKDFVLR